VSNWQWLCGAWLEWDGHPLVFTARCYEPEFFRNEARRMGRTVRFYREAVAAAYDTFGAVNVARHAQGKRDVYAAARASS
jgi:hypothetical protein